MWYIYEKGVLKNKSVGPGEWADYFEKGVQI